jgi:hypothetical protein
MSFSYVSTKCLSNHAVGLVTYFIRNCLISDGHIWSESFMFGRSKVTIIIEVSPDVVRYSR